MVGELRKINGWYIPPTSSEVGVLGLWQRDVGGSDGHHRVESNRFNAGTNVTCATMENVSKEPQNDLVQDGKSCTEYKIN